MPRERILSLFGYDRAVWEALSRAERSALRVVSCAWLASCLLLGLAAAYAAWLIAPSRLAPLLGGAGVSVLAINLLRVITAGGGARIGRNVAESLAAAGRYQPSLTPAVVFAVLAALLAQPAQLFFWPGLSAEVDVHRQELIAQHAVASEALGTSDVAYRSDLEEAGFLILRLQLMWREPKHALQWTLLFCLLVTLPAWWSRFFALRALRAYEAHRCTRTHKARSRLRGESALAAEALLSKWPTYTPAPAGSRSPQASRSAAGPWLKRSSS